MGIAVAIQPDGKVDLYITNFPTITTAYRNEGDGVRRRHFSRWNRDTDDPFLVGNGFLDYDNDGLLDIFVANGMCIRELITGLGTTWRSAVLLRNLDGSKFQERLRQREAASQSLYGKRSGVR